MNQRIKQYYNRYSLLLVIILLAAGSSHSQGINNLEIFSEEYPRAGYFRIAEFNIRADYKGQTGKYEEWRNRFSDLSGIMGKTEYEELLRNNPYDQIWDWFNRFKNDYPNKFVMVHMNGRGRIPNYKLEKFSPGHWLYFEGTNVLSNLPDENSLDYEKTVWIEVENADRFRMDNGSKMNKKDDITLVRKKKDGSLDWEHAEYVRLVDKKGTAIQIERAMFGSKARKFSKKDTYAAPHIMEGPWGATANMPWYYNFSTECPKDKNGKTCSDILLEELAGNFKKGGRWQHFDGVQFDVMMSEPTTGYHEKRKALGERADVNMDGKQDDGFINGIQTYGLGLFNFIERLRAAVGPDKIIAADGRNIGSQQVGNKSLNGIEMEGFPAQRPYGFAHWSTPINLLNFWKGVTAAPQFNYAAMRYDNPDSLSKEDLFNHYRLAFAGSVFTNSFILANSWTTLRGIPDLHELFNIPKEQPATGWLGKPTGEAFYYATSSENKYKDWLFGRGNPMSASVLEKKYDTYVSADENVNNATAVVTNEHILTVSPQNKANTFSFKIENIPYENGQMYIDITMRSAKLTSPYPKGYLRSVSFILNGVKAPKQLTNIVKMNEDWFTYRIYFANTYDKMFKKPIVYNPKGQTKLMLDVVVNDVIGPLEIASVSVTNAPEIVGRKFEKGFVFANLSSKDFTWDKYKVTIPAKDAVFLKSTNK